ncbi:ferritin family protein [Deferrisoma palaeochoriense]
MHPTDLREALDQAIRAEEEACNFYEGAAQTTDHPGGQAMFRELAAFERHHRRHLEELREALLHEKPWPEYQPRDLPPRRTEGDTPASTPSPHADALEALRIAAETEAEAEERYRRLAHQAPDRQGRELFLRLAEEEAMHRKVLEDQYYALSNRGVWLWGD